MKTINKIKKNKGLLMLLALLLIFLFTPGLFKNFYGQDGNLGGSPPGPLDFNPDIKPANKGGLAGRG